MQKNYIAEQGKTFKGNKTSGVLPHCSGYAKNLEGFSFNSFMEFSL